MTNDPTALSDVLKILGAIVGAMSGQSLVAWLKENHKEERLSRLEQAFCSHTGQTLDGLRFNGSRHK